jgi:hypothetical protein
MQRSSESIAALAATLAKAQMVLTNPEKSLTGTVPTRSGRRAAADLSLCPPLERPRHRPQGLRGARDRHRADDLDRSGGPGGIPDDDAGARLWRVDRLGLAGVRPHRHYGAAADGGGPDLCPALCPVHLGRHWGEDDLDAPDLGGQATEGTCKPSNGLDAKRQDGNGADQPLGPFAASRKPWSPPKQALEPEKSAVLRDRLLRSKRPPEPRAPWLPRTPLPRATVGPWGYSTTSMRYGGLGKWSKT